MADKVDPAVIPAASKSRRLHEIVSFILPRIAGLFSWHTPDLMSIEAHLLDTVHSVPVTHGE